MTVSIHAPAWGATDAAQGAAPALWGFNPRARVGRDGYIAERLAGSAGFNPRARVGRDGRQPLRPSSTACFNPRARVGRDVP